MGQGGNLGVGWALVGSLAEVALLSISVRLLHCRVQDLTPLVVLNQDPQGLGTQLNPERISNNNS